MTVCDWWAAILSMEVTVQHIACVDMMVPMQIQRNATQSAVNR